MKNLIKTFLFLVLLGIPTVVIAQVDKHSINTKGTGANNNTASASCPPVNPAVTSAAQDGLKTRTKSNQSNERTSAPTVDPVVASQDCLKTRTKSNQCNERTAVPAITPESQARLKTRTKSNNANERALAEAVRIIQAGCSQATPIDPAHAITFSWIKPSYDGKEYVLRVWEVSEGKTAAESNTKENLLLETNVGTADFYNVVSLPRRPRMLPTLAWEVRVKGSLNDPTSGSQNGTFILGPESN